MKKKSKFIKKDNIEELKLQDSQKILLNMVAQFRDFLQQHFRIVELKSKKLIDDRWNN